jgi:hypothetical protein
MALSVGLDLHFKVEYGKQFQYAVLDQPVRHPAARKYLGTQSH